MSKHSRKINSIGGINNQISLQKSANSNFLSSNKTSRPATAISGANSSTVKVVRDGMFNHKVLKIVNKRIVNYPNHDQVGYKKENIKEKVRPKSSI